MSDNINAMNVKQLRNEVQLLRDELAIMKRKYEDIIYNLDDDNFSSRFVKEKGAMRTAIEVNAEGIKTKVSREDLDNSLSEYTTLEQTSNAIKTHAYASADLSSAEEINNLTQATDKTKTYYILDSHGNKTYYYYNEISKDWEEIIGGGIDTVFEQTSTGFKLKGNVLIDGDTVVTENLKLSGNVTWDMSNSPVLTQYSSDGVSWHSLMVDGDLYMQMSFDGGKSWSTTTKVVGTDGKDGVDGEDGQNGSNAYVTAQNVFDALTSGGTVQGLFPAFYDGGEKLFINAAFIKTGQLSADRIDTENLSCTRLYAKDYNSGYYAKMSSNVGDFGVYNPLASSGAYPNNPNCIWGIYHSDAMTEVVNFYSYGNNYMGYNNSQEKLYPKGVWDFSACDDVQGLDAFVSGGGSGTVVAVFG